MSLQSILAEFEAMESASSETQPPKADKAKGGRRRVQAVNPSTMVVNPPVFESVDNIRLTMQAEVDNYVSNQLTTNRMLLSVDPGVGKTFLGVQTAHKAQMQGEAVVYFMPRHDFFDSLVAASKAQGYGEEYFMLWKPRTEETPRFPETCHLTEQIGEWMKRGHESKKFCSGVCGKDFMFDSCVYWAQINEYKHKAQALGVPPILCLQHAHLTLGHPLLSKQTLAIGDESPLLSAFAYEFHVPAKFLTIGQPNVPAKAIGKKMQALCKILGDEISGSMLIDALGGADHLLKLIDQSEFEEDKTGIAIAENVEHVNYNYLLNLCILLRREAMASKHGEYPNRVILSPTGLKLLLRRVVNPELPAKTIWLDGTADERLYKEMTGWSLSTLTKNAQLLGSVNQIVDSVFAKTSMLVDSAKATPKARQVVNYVKHLIKQHGYVNPLIVSYKNDELAQAFSEYQYTYFHGNRGSNAYQDCDACIVIGTPQPSAGSIEYEARKLFHKRNTPFNATWCEVTKAYAGTDRAMVASGLWNDPDLQTILQQIREQEIVQSIHRVRPVLSTKPIWLLTSLPVDKLPPTRLTTMLEAIGLVDTVDKVGAFMFLDALDIAMTKIDECGYCTSADLALLLDISQGYANRLIDALIAYNPAMFPETTIRAVGRGRPKRAIGK